jgi:hypothetical protein
MAGTAHGADHHQAGVNADSDGQSCVRPHVGQAVIQGRHPLEQPEARTDGTLGVVFVRPRPSEVDQERITEQLGDVAVEVSDNVGTDFLVSAHDVPKVLRVQPLGERCEVHQITEHHCELTALGTRRLELGRNWLDLRQSSRRWRRSFGLADPNQDLAVLVNGQALAADQFDPEVVEGLIIKLKLTLKGTIRDAPALLQEGGHSVQEFVKAHGHRLRPQPKGELLGFP